MPRKARPDYGGQADLKSPCFLDTSVAQIDYAVGKSPGCRPVGGDDYGPAVAMELGQMGQYGLCVGRVEIAGRLIGKDNPGPVKQRPGHRGALLLSGAQFGWLMGCSFSQAESL